MKTHSLIYDDFFDEPKRAKALINAQEMRDVPYSEPDPIIPVLPYDPGQRDKEVRATAATPTVQSGKCFLPSRKIIGQDESGNEIDLIEEFISEHERFPKGSYDDMVDTTSMMVNYFSKRIPLNPRIRSL